MRKALLAIFAALGFSAAIISAEVRLVDGTDAPLEAVERSSDGARVLVKSKLGQAWIPDKWLAADRLDVVAFEAAIQECETLLRNSEADAAFAKLINLVQQSPTHDKARRLLALSMRRRGRFEAALFLLEGLIAEAKEREGRTPYELLLERAEVAVLSGDQRVARKALSALKVDREGREMERLLSRQLNGGKAVTFAAPPPAIFSREAKALERASYNADYGSNALAAKVSLDIQAHLNRTPYLGDGKLAELTRLVTKVAKEARIEFEAGGDQEVFASYVSEADIFILVKKERWLGLWDWQKRVELELVAQILSKRFPNAISRVQLVAQTGDDEGSRYNAARVTFLRDGDKPQVTLLTNQNYDGARHNALIKELEDFQENRRGRR